MTAVRLSDRQHAALLALADLNRPVGGEQLAEKMIANGRQTSIVAAHQAANGLDNKGLAVKRYVKGSPIEYEITKQGRELAARTRPAS